MKVVRTIDIGRTAEGGRSLRSSSSTLRRLAPWAVIAAGGAVLALAGLDRLREAGGLVFAMTWETAWALILGFALLAFLAIVGLLFVRRARTRVRGMLAMVDAPTQDRHETAAAAHDDAEAFTCPMHADIRSAKPGACPKCGMQLVGTATSAGRA